MPKPATPDARTMAEPAAYLDMPPARREAAIAHAALLSVTMQRVAAELPFTADADDFRRILIAESK